MRYAGALASASVAGVFVALQAQTDVVNRIGVLFCPEAAVLYLNTRTRSIAWHPSMAPLADTALVDSDDAKADALSVLLGPEDDAPQRPTATYAPLFLCRVSCVTCRVSCVVRCPSCILRRSCVVCERRQRPCHADRHRRFPEAAAAGAPARGAAATVMSASISAFVRPPSPSATAPNGGTAPELSHGHVIKQPRASWRHTFAHRAEFLPEGTDGHPPLEASLLSPRKDTQAEASILLLTARASRAAAHVETAQGGHADGAGASPRVLSQTTAKEGGQALSVASVLASTSKALQSARAPVSARRDESQADDVPAAPRITSLALPPARYPGADAPAAAPTAASVSLFVTPAADRGANGGLDASFTNALAMTLALPPSKFSTMDRFEKSGAHLDVDALQQEWNRRYWAYVCGGVHDIVDGDADADPFFIRVSSGTSAGVTESTRHVLGEGDGHRGVTGTRASISSLLPPMKNSWMEHVMTLLPPAPRLQAGVDAANAILTQQLQQASVLVATAPCEHVRSPSLTRTCGSMWLRRVLVHGVACVVQVAVDYVHSARKAILDYILRDAGERKRLNILRLPETGSMHAVEWGWGAERVRWCCRQCVLALRR